jgi:DNA polymerase-4
MDEELSSITALCRDCLAEFVTAPALCPTCGSRRLVSHPELGRLSLAHIDCDAFYATIEKRDNPALADLPVLVGHPGGRGVVTTACYVARRFGPRSAMPMYKALELCPQAVVIPPHMEKYKQVSSQVRAIFDSATPIVEPLSLDEAFLDLSGTATLFRRTPAATLAHIARTIEREINITVSIGLSDVKFLAKMASDVNKPRGFTVIGRAEAVSFLHDLPVTRLPGVGPALAARLKVDGFFTIGDLQARAAAELAARYGETGTLLAKLARGLDERTVHSDRTAKSISAETTFERDISALDELLRRLWPLCERVAERLKKNNIAGRTVSLKLKTARFKLLTRHHRLSSPTQLAEQIYRAAKPLLEKETAELKKRGSEGRFRLIGVGVENLGDADTADPTDLFAVGTPDAAAHLARVEQAMDEVRARFGRGAIGKGRGFRGPRR